MTPTFDDWLARRNAALLALDMDYARSALSVLVRQDTPLDDAVVLTVLHKARVEATSLPDAARRESARWLRERGFQRMTGEAADPDHLPTGAR
jgi:hypothetical protein